MYLEYIKNYIQLKHKKTNSPIKKAGKGFEQTFLQRHTDDQ